MDLTPHQETVAAAVIRRMATTIEVLRTMETL